MDNTAQAEKAEAGPKRQAGWTNSYTIGVTGLVDFYRLVRGLNRQLGHGGWTIRGRPLRLVKRIDKYNSMRNFRLSPDAWDERVLHLEVKAPPGNDLGVFLAKFEI